MKTKDLKSLKIKKTDELKKILSEKLELLAKIKLDMVTGKEKNLKKVKNLRREIAQVFTLIREKELVEAEKPKE